MGDFDACRFDFRLDAKNGLMPSKRRKTERIQPSNYSTLFKCKICGTLFACRTLLLEHKQMHSEYRYGRSKYECALCTDRRFSRKDHLRDHLTREHQLDGAKVAEVMGDGRPKHHAAAVARKSRGGSSSAPNRKSSSAADGSCRRSVARRTPKNSAAKEVDDDVRDASRVAADDVSTAAECSSTLGGAFQSNSVTSAAPQTQTQTTTTTTTYGETSLPPNYLYINFPILITPTTTTTTATTSMSNDATTTRLHHHHNHHHSMIQGDADWSTLPSLPVDLARRIKVEIGDQLTSQPVVTSSHPGNVFDLPTALSRFLAYNSYVTSRQEDDVVDERKYGIPATSGGVNPFDFFVSAIRRTIGRPEDRRRGRSVESATTMIDLGNDLGIDLGDEGGFSEKEETALDFSLKKRSSHLACRDHCNRRSDAAGSYQPELDDVVDLSRKNWLSSKNADHPDQRRNDGNRMGKWSAPWNIGNIPSSSEAFLLPAADAAKPSEGPVGSNPGSKASSVRCSQVIIGQGSTSRGKSALNRTVEKLWKNKIGRISNPAEAARSLETEGVSLDFAGENRGGQATDRPWNLSAESPTKTDRATRSLDVAPVSLLQRIDDKDDCDQPSHKRHSRDNYTCKSTADEDNGGGETRIEEDIVEDLTTSVLSRNCTTAEPGSQSDGIVSPSSSPPPAAEWNNFPSKDLPSVRLPHRVADLDSMPFSQSEQLFNQIMRDLELTSILKSSSEDGAIDNKNKSPSDLWTSNSKGSEDVETVDDTDSTPDGERPEGNGGGPTSTATDDRHQTCGYPPQCGRNLREWRHLKVHVTPNGGEKPILGCYLCRYTCRHRSSMNWHMKTKHRMEKSKMHGNRTLYVVDSAAAAEAEAEAGLVCRGRGGGGDDDSSQPEPETGISQFPADTGREKCCDGSAAVVAASAAEDDDEEEPVFLNSPRNNRDLLANGLESSALQSCVVVGTGGVGGAGGGGDVTLTDSSAGVTEDDARPMEDDATREATRSVTAEEPVHEESLPQLLLKKVTASPGKDPKFYTSLMRLKYVKRPSTKFHAHRQPSQRRRPSPAKRNETAAAASDVTVEAKRRRRRRPPDAETAPSFRVVVCIRCGFAADNQTELQSHVLATHGKEMRELRDSLLSTCDRSNSRGISHHPHHRHHHHHHHHLLSHKMDASAQNACPVVDCSQRFAGTGTVRHHPRPVRPGALTTSTDAEETGVSLQDAEPPQSSSTPPPPPPPPVGISASPLAPVQTDERPVACDYPGCDKSFRELKHLKVHQMQHTDEKPLRCHICEYSCRQRNSLNWHMKSKHGQEKQVTNDGRTVYI